MKNGIMDKKRMGSNFSDSMSQIYEIILDKSVGFTEFIVRNGCLAVPIE